MSPDAEEPKSQPNESFGFAAGGNDSCRPSRRRVYSDYFWSALTHQMYIIGSASDFEPDGATSNPVSAKTAAPIPGVISEDSCAAWLFLIKKPTDS
jgi:hypothetical protein